MTLRDRLVEDWRRAHKWASVRLSTIGAALFSALAAFPQIGAEAWNALPASLRERLPDHITQWIAAALFASVILARIHQKQEKPDG
jgi:hypothetical protein